MGYTVKLREDFTGGPVVKKLPTNAGDMGFDLWFEKIPNAMEQLNPCAKTTDPTQLELVLCNKRSDPSEKPVHN